MQQLLAQNAASSDDIGSQMRAAFAQCVASLSAAMPCAPLPSMERRRSSLPKDATNLPLPIKEEDEEAAVVPKKDVELTPEFIDKVRALWLTERGVHVEHVPP